MICRKHPPSLACCRACAWSFSCKAGSQNHLLGQLLVHVAKAGSRLAIAGQRLRRRPGAGRALPRRQRPLQRLAARMRLLRTEQARLMTPA